MKSCIISIKNDTDLTPEITQINLDDCCWVNSQEIDVPKAIANHSTVVGMVEGTPEYQIQMVVRSYLYSENIEINLTVKQDNVEAVIDQNNHFFCSAKTVEQEGIFLVLLELETYAKIYNTHQEAINLLGGGGDDYLIVRAGSVTNLIDVINNDGGTANNISVNRSLKAYSRSKLSTLLTQLSQSDAFKSRKQICYAWEKNIIKKQGTIRQDKLKDNKYHALLDNLKAKNVGGLFVNVANPNYDPNQVEELVGENSL